MNRQGKVADPTAAFSACLPKWHVRGGRSGTKSALSALAFSLDRILQKHRCPERVQRAPEAQRSSHLLALATEARAFSKSAEEDPRPPAALGQRDKGIVRQSLPWNGTETFKRRRLKEDLSPHPGLIKGPGAPKDRAPRPWAGKRPLPPAARPELSRYPESGAPRFPSTRAEPRHCGAPQIQGAAESKQPLGPRP